jgi:prevent-host-death family protein
VTMKEPKPHRVGIAEFKARLSEYLRGVRRGEPITLYDRDTPVARVVPLESRAGPLVVREAVTRPQDVDLPAPLGRPIDSLAALLEERQGER